MNRILRPRRSNMNKYTNNNYISDNDHRHDSSYSMFNNETNNNYVFKSNKPSYETHNNYAFESNKPSYEHENQSFNIPQYTQHLNRNNQHQFSEIETNKFGENVVNVSNSKFTNMDNDELKDILKFNDDPGKNAPAGQCKFEDYRNYESKYKYKLINNAVQDVYDQSNYYNKHESVESRTYENQLNNPVYTTDLEHERLLKNTANYLYKTMNKFE